MANFAKTYLSGSHVIADTTFNVTTGTGTRFTANKYATVWRMPGYSDPADAKVAGKCEVVLIGTPSANSMTVTRAQLGTTAFDMNDGAVYQIFEGVYTNQILPLQTSNSGKVLTTDASNPSWAYSVIPVTFYNVGANLNPGSTAYAAPMAWIITQGSDTYRMPMPACSVVGLICSCESNAVSGSTVFTIRKDSVDTAFTATIAQSATTGSNIASTPIDFTLGQYLSVKIVTASGGSTMNKITFTVLIRFTV